MARTAEERLAYNRARYARHGARQRARQKERYQTDPEFRQKALDRERKKQYGITPEEYAEMLASHQGVCAVCKRPPIGGKSLCVDHCHATGQLRGLLCTNCNVALGHVADDLQRLSALAAYLVEWSG